LLSIYTFLAKISKKLVKKTSQTVKG